MTVPSQQPPDTGHVVGGPDLPISHPFGPLAARNPELEVLLTDGLGGFAMSSLAGVPTRCYSGLVVSQQPPVRRYAHLAAPLEMLEVGGQRVALHALEIAPDVFEGRGLEVLSGAVVRDLLPEREQLVLGVRVRRRWFMPQGSGAVVFLYDLDSRDPVRLTLGGFFTDRDMHGTHQEAPSLHFESGGRELLVQAERTTRVSVHVPGASLEVLRPQPFTQRVYYRQDRARGETDTEYLTGAALWDVYLPAGGGRLAVVFQGLASTLDGTPVAAVTDPWQAHSQEVARRRMLVAQATRATGLHDELLGTLAVAADAYLVRRTQPPGLSVIAGYPWFADWGRDAMLALTGLTLLTGRPADARDLLGTYLRAVRRGLLPNNFHEDGQGAGYNTVDAALWLAVSLERYISVTGDLNFARQTLPALRELLDAHLRGTDHGIGTDPLDGLLRAGQPGVQLTWMDVKIGDWVVTPRHGKAIEVQGLWLAALGAEGRISGALGQEAQFTDVLRRARQGFGQFWTAGQLAAGQEAGRFMDVLGSDGMPDGSLRPNVLVALALPDTPCSPEQADATLRDAERCLLTPLGLHTLSPFDARYRGDYGGSQVQRDAAYHQGTVWPWPLTAYVEVLLARGDVRRAREALSGLTGHVWEAGLGHVSEVFAGKSLRPGGCPFQAWSVAEFLRAHVLVSLAERQQAFHQRQSH